MLQSKTKLKQFATKLAVLLFWLGVWQGAFLLVEQPLLLASPFEVLKRLSVLIFTSDFWQSVFVSFLRTGSGYILGVILGSLLACLTSALKIANEVLSPIISIARSTPVASFIILALVWIKKDYVPIFIVLLIVFPVIWSNVSEGISNTEKRYLESAKIYNFSFFKTVKVVYFHSVLPSFRSGCTAALGLAWKSGAAAEVLAMPVKSIGYHLYRSKIEIETADLFAWTAVVVLLSAVLEKIIKKLLMSNKKAYEEKVNNG